jgi:hypothetical protein
MPWRMRTPHKAQCGRSAVFVSRREPMLTALHELSLPREAILAPVETKQCETAMTMYGSSHVSALHEPLCVHTQSIVWFLYLCLVDALFSANGGISDRCWETRSLCDGQAHAPTYGLVALSCCIRAVRMRQCVQYVSICVCKCKRVVACAFSLSDRTQLRTRKTFVIRNQLQARSLFHFV